MNRAPCVCSGEATGIRCAHYWRVSQRIRAANAEFLREGIKQRACTVTPGWPLEFTEDEKPSYCNRYEPAKEPGLVNIMRRAVGLGGYAKYDAQVEEFRPMTPEEVAKLREEFPDDPREQAFANGKNPGEMTADDIMNGPQIGILPPGAPVPDGKLDEQAEDAIAGIFGKPNTLERK